MEEMNCLMSFCSPRLHQVKSKFHYLLLFVFGYLIGYSIWSFHGDIEFKVIFANKRHNNHLDLRSLDIYNLSIEVKEEYDCRYTKTNPKTTVCLHEEYRDIYISHDLADTGVWESAVANDFQEFLKKGEDTAVIDLGANIGFYTMLAASMGRKVLAVEPLPSNYLRLAKAVQLEHVEHLVTVVTNAVSDRRGNASLIMSGSNKSTIAVNLTRLFSTGNNQGDTRIRPYKSKRCMFFCQPRVTMVTLDDILAACNFTNAIMKIDIQGFEHRAFSHATRLLDNVKVTYIFMEWSLMAKFKTDVINVRTDIVEQSEAADIRIVQEMIDYLLLRGYLPFSLNSNGERLLDTDEWHSWPFDIVWHLAPTFLDRCRLQRYRFLHWMSF